ncbi:MAG: GerMN domain-containing protein [Coriobacteriia bacterium]|nr:GerMN domain-containing protein [Coriobacteriia bacterium]
MRHIRTIAVMLGIALALAVPLAGGCTPDEPEQPATRGTTAEIAGQMPAESEITTPEPDPETAGEMSVTLYWVSAGESALGVARTLPESKAAATAAIEALIAGPTAAELTTWPAVSSSIPEGTRLLGLTVTDGIAKIDLSREFESDGGSFGMISRLAQVVYTLDQFPTIDAVEFYIEGDRATVFSNEGLTLDRPQTLDDYARLLPIDA